jgi:transposase
MLIQSSCPPGFARPAADETNDAMWLAELLAHGLIRTSFVPDTQTQEMRNLLRTRKQLVREQSSHVPRVQKTLEDANIKVDCVLLRYHGQERPCHDRGADCRRNQSRQTGEPCRSAGEGLAG